MNFDNLISFFNRLNKNVGEVNDNLRLLSGAPPSAFLFGGVFCVHIRTVCLYIHSRGGQAVVTAESIHICGQSTFSVGCCDPPQSIVLKFKDFFTIDRIVFFMHSMFPLTLASAASATTTGFSN